MPKREVVGESKKGNPKPSILYPKIKAFNLSVKNGSVRGKRFYWCKSCNHRFIGEKDLP